MEEVAFDTVVLTANDGLKLSWIVGDSSAPEMLAAIREWERDPR